MPWRNGLYVRLQSWVARAAAGAPISASEFDADGNDEASALNNCVLRDGTGVPTADLPMANHSLTGIRQGAAAGEPVEFSQWQAGSGAARNVLHNASLLVNQRGVTGTVSLAAGAYGHDRWKGGSGGASYSFGAVGADQQLNIGSGSLCQVVAGSDVSSASMTLSQAGTAQGRIYPVGAAAPVFSPLPLTVSNLTPGSPVIVEFGPGTVLQPQFETGPSAHGFARRFVADDLVLCQAYYEVRQFRFGGDEAYQTAQFTIFFKQTKVAVPVPSGVVLTISTSVGGVTPSVLSYWTDGLGVSFPASSNGFFVQGYVAVSCEP